MRAVLSASLHLSWHHRLTRDLGWKSALHHAHCSGGSAGLLGRLGLVTVSPRFLVRPFGPRNRLRPAVMNCLPRCRQLPLIGSLARSL